MQLLLYFTTISIISYCARRIQRGFPVDIVRNTNLLTYLLVSYSAQEGGTISNKLGVSEDTSR